MQILIWHDKHGDVSFAADTIEEFNAAALDIIIDRLVFQYIYEGDEHFDEATRVVKERDGKGARRLLDLRQDYEYERTSTSVVREPLVRR